MGATWTHSRVTLQNKQPLFKRRSPRLCGHGERAAWLRGHSSWDNYLGMGRCPSRRFINPGQARPRGGWQYPGPRSGDIVTARTIPALRPALFVPFFYIARSSRTRGKVVGVGGCTAIVWPGFYHECKLMSVNISKSVKRVASAALFTSNVPNITFYIPIDPTPGNLGPGVWSLVPSGCMQRCDSTPAVAGIEMRPTTSEKTHNTVA